MIDTKKENVNFIHQIIDEDLASGKHSTIVTRFPPEPNGYLHIGHAKAICLDFGTAKKYGGACHLRFDDTNPEKEEMEFVEAIKEDIQWLGFDWGEHVYHAADYFEQLYQYAIELIKKNKAYVCALNPEEFKEYRGIPTRPGKESPWRNRPTEENLELFQQMRDGKFEDGAYVLRAKIDMTSPNLHMRDPAMYRIKRGYHHRTGDEWRIYPMYDFAHGLSDSIEGITHSMCTLEFEVHRPLYDWFLDNLEAPQPQPRQIEFARLNLTYTVVSKRKLQHLVEEGRVDAWDDPRMPTLAGMRRRGYPPSAICAFCETIGITKYSGLTDVSLLEHCVRDELNRIAQRRLAVIRPLKVVIENYPEDEEEYFDAINNPEKPETGTRKVPFSREIWIEHDDFMEDPPRKYFRLAPGAEVRLKYACYIICREVIKNDAGEILELRCTYDPESRGASTPDKRKVKGTIHWVSARHAKPVEVRLYDRLFTVENPEADKDVDFKTHINPRSLETIQAFIEPSVMDISSSAPIQFERLGYFCFDSKDSKSGNPALNRTVALRDSWKK